MAERVCRAADRVGDHHLRHVFNTYVIYYNHNHTRAYLALGKDAPNGRPIETSGAITVVPILGGLYHRYARMAYLVGTESLLSKDQGPQSAPVGLAGAAYWQFVTEVNLVGYF